MHIESTDYRVLPAESINKVARGQIFTARTGAGQAERVKGHRRPHKLFQLQGTDGVYSFVTPLSAGSSKVTGWAK